MGYSVTPDAKPWTPPQSSSSSTSPQNGDQIIAQMPQARVSMPIEIPDPFVRFQRLLGRNEKASDHISAVRLAEHWPEEEEEDDNMTHEFEFETTLHALVRAQKLSAQHGSNGIAFPIPNKLDPADVKKFTGANILHLGSVIGGHPFF